MHSTKDSSWGHYVAALGFLTMLFVGMGVNAETSGSAPPSGGPPPSGNSALDTALKSCSESVSEDAMGGPDRAAMDACLKQKGFNPPPHGGKEPSPDGKKGPPPLERPGAGE